jgi:DNA-binding transcriptional ArsR family regulator
LRSTHPTEMQAVDDLKALANERRLQILDWLKEPTRHFPKQVDGDLVEDGVCAVLIAEKLGITPATLSEHMRVLVQAGLVRPKRIKQWIFYKRDERRIRVLKTELIRML